MTIPATQAHTCLRCGHRWHPMARLEGRLPRTCPKCKSYEWQTTRRQEEP